MSASAEVSSTALISANVDTSPVASSTCASPMSASTVPMNDCDR